MKKIKRIVISLLIFLYVFNLAMPIPADAASANYGVITVNSENSVQLYNNLVVISPAGNLMVKANSVSRKLGLLYSYNKVSKELTIKNPINRKSIVFMMGSRKFIYYSDANSKGIAKSAAYKFYYDAKNKCNVIHVEALKYILSYKYYRELTGTYYNEMGYKAMVVYNSNEYSDGELPLANELIDFVNTKTFTNKKELLDAVRMNLLIRRTKATFMTNRDVMEQIGSKNSIYSLVIGIDDKNTAKDADYLSLLIDKFGQSWRSSSKILISPDGSRQEVKTKDDAASLTIDVVYETTLEQEMVVDAKIAQIVKELDISAATDYEKVKRIHDYIINNSSYDTKFEKSSAYDLLIEKTAVCEGYTLIAYRLFLAAGLESRIISGYGNGEPHAWNIVKVDGEWYNIDLTWDDPITNTGRQMLRYDYFLKSDNDFVNHIRKAEYSSKEFLLAYKIAPKSYPINVE